MLGLCRDNGKEKMETAVSFYRHLACFNSKKEHPPTQQVRDTSYSMIDFGGFRVL